MPIIQVRGTSGSGKSTVIREVMKRIGDWTPIYQPTDGRKKPLYYCRTDFIVLGHYESPCGGGDTIGSAAQIYEVANKLLKVDPKRIVLCEGLLLSEDTKWSLQATDLRVIFLITDVEECIRRIKGRREEAGNEKPLNEANTRNRVATINRARLRLTEAGVECRRASTEQAPDIVLKWMGKRA